jgi:hypothetical protein
MRGLRFVVAVGLSLLMLSASACGATHAKSGAPQRTTAVQPASGGDFDPGNFDRSTVIDNAWDPMRPGEQFTWQGHAIDDGERVSRAVVFTVTDLTKLIDGVRTVVTWDRDYTDGHLEEGELSFFAQDNEGAVWLLGEYPEEYDAGKIVKTPAWIAGIHGARAGVLMQADPSPGTPSYAQGWGPEVNWTDRARVDQIAQQNCVPVDCYDDVLVIDEFNRDEPGAHQLKYYARGVGGIRVGWRGAKEEEQEAMVLVALRHLGAAAMAKVREKVLEQEGRAYRIIPDVYGQTERIDQTSSGAQGSP